MTPADLEAGHGRPAIPVALDLPAHALEQLAQALAPHVAELLVGQAGADGTQRWLTTREAAAYIGRSANALHKVIAAREIPFSQDGPGARCYFRCSDLDAWMRSR